MSPAGRAVLVTGAARGIGAESARRLAARGHRVALVGLEPELLAEVTASLPGEHAWFEADVTDTAALRAAVDGAADRLGGLDAVVANAGVGPIGTVATLPDTEFDRTIAVNLTGVHRTLKLALPHLVRRRGYALAVSSLSAILHAPMMGPYTASKAGVEALADALRVEVAPKGVAVGVAYFGFVETDLVTGTLDHPAVAASSFGGRNLLGGRLSAATAADAIVRGVERRSRTVVAPRYLPALRAVRGVLQPLSEAVLRRHPSTARSVRLAEEHPRGTGSGPLAPPRA